MSTRDYIYWSETIKAFQELSFNNENNNPVELVATSPKELAVEVLNNKSEVRLTIDKQVFTTIAQQWLTQIKDEN